MKKTIIKKLICCLLFACLSFCLLPFNIFTTKAEDKLNKDGVYSIEFSAYDEDGEFSSMKVMGFENGEKKAILEKIGDNYYLTISLNLSNADKFTLSLPEGKIGETYKKDKGIGRYTYSLSLKSLQNSIDASMYIVPMDTTKIFKIKPLLNTAKYIGEIENKDKDRPAIFVPELNVSASSGEMEKGSVYIIPKVEAKLGEEVLTPTTDVYYIKEGEKVAVEIQDGKLILKNVGEYHVVFRAESDKYKTLLGKNTFVEKDVTLMSKIGASSLVKIEDINKVLPDNASVQGTYLNKGETFNNISTLMKKKSDNYEIINVVIYSESGEELTPEGQVELFIRANNTYSRGKLKVYHLEEDNTLTNVDYENYGRYIKLNTDKTGDFIVSIPGVAFHMPMWGYMVICIASIIVIAGIIVTIVIVTKKRKKKAKEI